MAVLNGSENDGGVVVDKEAPPKVNKKDKASSNQKQESIIYVGPNLAGRLSRFTVFRDGIPAHLAELIGDRPEISRLIVPVSQMGETQAAINTQGTMEYKAYKLLNEKVKS